jgi:tRNA 2-thiouridine synthesizing protein E
MNGFSELGESMGDLQEKVRVVAGKEIVFDDEGFLWRPEDWTEEVGRVLASESGMEVLGDARWRVIRFLREYYAYHGRAPMNRDLRAGLGMSLMDLEALFPGGIRKGARRIAGLPNPRSCT